ncbi:unnamed protein product [Adineta ricciae]|uniref:Putative auto-transporter adhesin head GIN domain-containing protein n=1 Tax=Adineta ricciae TaxID=249248 RepID=A0A813P9P7_ADIRI|nr:unnamed protein product [Adineta ricciae]CAF1359792.1 unnamed protein product [Adineta ricciae]
MFFYILVFLLCFSLVQSQINDTVIRQTRPLSSFAFDEILVNGAFDVFLTQTSNESLNPTVEIEAPSDVQNNVLVEIVNNHILFISMNGSTMTNKNIYAYIRFRSPLYRYTIKGTGNVLTDDNGISSENTEGFTLDNQGVANVAMRLNVKKFQVYHTGTGNSRFWGEVRGEAYFDAKGVGDINALSLTTNQAKVRSTGVSIVRVAAIDDVQIEVSGVSNVYYRLPAGKKPSKAISTGLGKIVLIH